MHGWFFETDKQKDPLPLKSFAKRGHCKGSCQMDIGTCFQPHLSYSILIKNKALLSLHIVLELHNQQISLGRVPIFYFKQRALAHGCIITALGVILPQLNNSG